MTNSLHRRVTKLVEFRRSLPVHLENLSDNELLHIIARTAPDSEEFEAMLKAISDEQLERIFQSYVAQMSLQKQNVSVVIDRP